MPLERTSFFKTERKKLERKKNHRRKIVVARIKSLDNKNPCLYSLKDRRQRQREREIEIEREREKNETFWIYCREGVLPARGRSEIDVQ